MFSGCSNCYMGAMKCVSSGVIAAQDPEQRPTGYIAAGSLCRSVGKLSE